MRSLFTSKPKKNCSQEVLRLLVAGVFPFSLRILSKISLVASPSPRKLALQTKNLLPSSFFLPFPSSSAPPLLKISYPVTCSATLPLHCESSEDGVTIHPTGMATVNSIAMCLVQLLFQGAGPPLHTPSSGRSQKTKTEEGGVYRMKVTSSLKVIAFCLYLLMNFFSSKILLFVDEFNNFVTSVIKL